MRRYLIPLFLLAGPLPAQETPPPADHARLRTLLEAEDARAPDAASLEVLASALGDGSPWIRAYAARALGRLERPGLVDVLVPALRDAAATVRARAAWAIAQSLHGGGATGQVRTARASLRNALLDERDPAVRAAILEAVGRLAAGDAAAATEASALIADHTTGSSPSEVGLGAARGLYFLARQRAARGALSPAAVALLHELATAPRTGESGRRMRVAAIQAIGASGTASASLVESLQADPDASVRREALAAAGTLADTSRLRPLLASGLRDRDASVRVAALGGLRRLAPATTCPLAARAADDPHPHVALTGIQALVRCPEARMRLDSIAGTLTPDGRDWQRPAAALGSLATVDPARAAAHLPAFVRHANPFVRAHAAVAAAATGDAATLRALAGDPDPNVRTAAVTGLARTDGHAADPLYVAQLEHDDGQLLMAAAAALEGSTHPAALPALLDALERIGTQRRETSRDPRMALLDRIEALGSPMQARRLEPALRDFDPVIASRAADILGRWTGTRPQPAPEPLPRLELPTLPQLLDLQRARVSIAMEDGGTIELRLRPFDAPTNAWRFARLAREGRYDGLTFHRVVPNFVIQGGSPAANEYAGAGPFTRDELGQPNWHGTVGLSTRGRDTGDAQIFVNLVDNIRLDPDYTVFAEVVDGMAVADRVLEGARIRSVTVRTP